MTKSDQRRLPRKSGNGRPPEQLCARVVQDQQHQHHLHAVKIQTLGCHPRPVAQKLGVRPCDLCVGGSDAQRATALRGVWKINRGKKGAGERVWEEGQVCAKTPCCAKTPPPRGVAPGEPVTGSLVGTHTLEVGFRRLKAGLTSVSLQEVQWLEPTVLL